jgi:hypothetical protein
MTRSYNVHNLGARATFVYMLRDCGRSSSKGHLLHYAHSLGGQGKSSGKYPAEQCRVHHSASHFAENQGGGEGEYEIQIADGNRNFAIPGIYIPPSQTEIIKFTLLDSPQCEI